MEINIRSEVNDIAEEIVAIRRDIHKHPELGFEVHRTAELVSNHLKKLGFNVSDGIGKTGVVGDLIGNSDGPTIGLRADMDALPIQETSNLPYSSVTVPILVDLQIILQKGNGLFVSASNTLPLTI